VATTVDCALGAIGIQGYEPDVYPLLVSATLGTITIQSYIPDILHVKDKTPDNNDDSIAPNRHIRFTLFTSGRPDVEDFEGGSVPTGWTLCITGNGYTHTSWNGGADNWDVYNDGGNKVLRCQGKGTVVANGIARPHTSGGHQDIVARVKWHTGATAGILARSRHTTYSKETQGVDGILAWIDAGGLRLGDVTNGGVPNSDEVDSFSPVDGTWYWIRLQLHRDSVRYRAKYWTGIRSDEPAAWGIAWDPADNSKNNRDDRPLGTGFYCYAGTAYFDDFEQRDVLDRDYLDQIVIDINGTEIDLDDVWYLSPTDQDETWESDTVQFPDVSTINFVIDPWLIHDNDDRSQQVTVKWDTGTPITIQQWSYNSASFPQDHPDVTGAGDPSRMGSFITWTDEILPRGRYFTWLAELFLESMGSQYCAFNVAPITWRGYYENFNFNVVFSIYTPVDGEYLIGHPVFGDHDVSIIPAQPEITDHKSNVVVKGSLHERFASSIVPQAYTRKDHKASISPTIVLWLEDDSSVIVSQEEFMELDASGLAFDRRIGTTFHFRVIDQGIHDQLKIFGVTLEPYFTVGRIGIAGLDTNVIDSGTAHATLGTIAVQGYNFELLGQGTYVPATLGTITVQGNNVSIYSTTKVSTGTGAITVAGYNPSVYVEWYDTDWKSRFKVTFLNAQVEADLTMDILITEADVPSGFWSKVDTQGDDIVVTDIQNTKLKRDLGFIDTTGEKMELRSKVSVLASTNVDVWVYYNNSGASETNDTDTYDLNQELVLPIQELIADTPPELKDRTANDNDGSQNGALGNVVRIDGKVQKCWDFDGQSGGNADWIDCGNDTSLQITDDLTAMCWVKYDGSGRPALLKYGTVGSTRAWFLGRSSVSAAKFQIIFSDDGTYDAGHRKNWYSSIDAFVSAEWHHIAVTFDGGTVKMFVDGQEDTSPTKTEDDAITTIHNTAKNLTLAAYDDTTTDAFEGAVDMAHVFSRVLTPAEIETRYNNENNPGAFYNCGAEETP
jgi:hypothetical protein